MDAQIIYFYKANSATVDSLWTHAALPMITDEFLTFQKNAYNIMEKCLSKNVLVFLKYLGSLCAEDGAMKGW